MGGNPANLNGDSEWTIGVLVAQPWPTGVWHPLLRRRGQQQVLSSREYWAPGYPGFVYEGKHKIIHEITSQEINCHQINSHEINLPSDQLNSMLRNFLLFLTYFWSWTLIKNGTPAYLKPQLLYLSNDAYIIATTFSTTMTKFIKTHRGGEVMLYEGCKYPMIRIEHNHPPDQASNKAGKLVSFIRKGQCSSSDFLDAITGLQVKHMFHVLFFSIKN